MQVFPIFVLYPPVGLIRHHPHIACWMRWCCAPPCSDSSAMGCLRAPRRHHGQTIMTIIAIIPQTKGGTTGGGVLTCLQRASCPPACQATAPDRYLPSAGHPAATRQQPGSNPAATRQQPGSRCPGCFVSNVSATVLISADLCRMSKLPCSFLLICVECLSSRAHFC